MHDAGGNPVNTIAALPGIIEFYRTKGYRFVDMNGVPWDGQAPAAPPIEASPQATPSGIPTSAWGACVLEPAAERCRPQTP